MNILKTSFYLPSQEVTSKELENKLNLEEGYIEKRTGILKRFYVEENEKIEDIAIKATKELLKDVDQKEKIGFIIVATTTPCNYMPGISNYIQKELGLEKCNCYDILAGCNGFVTAIDIANMYFLSNKSEMGIVIGVDVLSKYTDKNDISTSIILSDGAGAVLLEKNDEKDFKSVIYSIGKNNEILTCNSKEKISMKGKEIYKYAVTETVNAIKEVLEKSQTKMEDIKYIIPHQSNKKIMKAIVNRLKIEEEKMYINIENVGNTFCASIPIALNYMEKDKLLKKGDKILLLGYGGGLNTGCILLEY